MNPGAWRLARDEQARRGGDTQNGAGTERQNLGAVSAGADLSGQLIKLHFCRNKPIAIAGKAPALLDGAYG
jgi:hypothetical protein